MSDETTGGTGEQEAEVSPSQESPEQESQQGAEEKEAPKTQAEARRAARQRGRERQEARAASREEAKKREARREQAEKRERDDSGRFRPEGEDESQPEDTAAEDGGGEGEQDPADTGGEQDADASAADEGRSTDEGADAGADEDRSDFVRVQLPDGHELRETGRGEIAVASEEDAELVRALANGTYTRRREVEELGRRNSELEEKLQQYQQRDLEQEVSREVTQRYKQTDAYKAKAERYREIHDTVGPEAANEYWQSVRYELQGEIQKELRQRRQQQESQRVAQEGQRWVKQTYNQYRQSLPEEVVHLPKFDDLFARSVQVFNAALEQGDYPEVRSVDEMNQEFRTFFLTRLSREPEVREAFERARAASGQNGNEAPPPTKSEEELREEIREELKREYAEKRQDSPPNPLSGVGHASGTDRVSTSTDDQKDLDKLSPQQLQRRGRQRARERGREIRR